jgi:hypothetical protein
MADDSREQVDTPPRPDPELRRLDPLVGSWHSEDRTGDGEPVTSTETTSWLDGGYFLARSYETTFGNEPPQRGVNYWGYDAAAGRFRIIFFSNNGPFTEDGNRYEGVVADGKLTFEGPARFQYDLDDEGRIRIDADGSFTERWWLRDASGEWTPWMTNTFRRT